MAGRNELVGILPVHGLALALLVGAVGAAHALAFVNHDAAPGQRFQNVLLSAGHEAVLVRVLDAEEHLAAQLAGQQVVVQSRAYAADVQRPGGRGRKAHPNFSLSHNAKKARPGVRNAPQR